MVEPPVIVEITGSKRADLLIGGSGTETFSSLAGDDTVESGGGADTLGGGDGHDLFLTLAHGAFVYGGPGFDTVDFLNSATAIHATARPSGETSETDIVRLQGVEKVNGSAFADRIVMDGRSNQVNGNGGDDQIVLGASVNDGAQGVESASGGSGNDTLFGGAGQDHLSGNEGKDDLRGGGDDDLLRGRLGADTLRGGAGDDDDWLRGRAGDDFLRGGAGRDQFRFVSALDEGHDVISDFDIDEDRFVIHTNLFKSAPDVSARDIRVTVDGADLLIDYGDALSASIRVLGLADQVDDFKVQVF